MHGGKAPQVAKAARRRIVESDAAARLRAAGYEPSIDPVAEFLSLGAEITALKDVLRSMVAELAGDAPMAANNLGREDVAGLMRAYERALDRCERTLTNMLRLDLQARQVTLAERDADALWSAITTGLTAIGAERKADTFRAVVAAELRQAA